MVSTKPAQLFGPYRLGKTLGQGEFGKVKLAFHTENSNNPVAIKFISKKSIDSESRRQKLLREVTILQSLDHRFIVKLHEVIETELYIGMIMGYYSGGELFNHILARRYLKESEAVIYFAQLIAGVSYIHGMGVVHRDLKLENLLLDEARNIIITDFGFSNRVSKGNGSRLNTSCGSPCYAAPELVVNDNYSGESADVWSCGVILYAMLSGYLPFDDDPNNADGENIKVLYKYILETKVNYPKHISALAKSLINRILITDPLSRANLPEIKAHKWLLPAKFVFDQEEKFNATAIDSHVAQIVDVDKVFADSPFNETESADSTPTIIDKGPLVTRRSSLTIEYPLKEIQNNFSNNNLGTHKSGRKRSYSVENLKSDELAKETCELNQKATTAAIIRASELAKEAQRQRNQLNFHSGPLDSRSISTLPPKTLGERIELVLGEMNYYIKSKNESFKFTVVLNEGVYEKTSILTTVAKYPKELYQQLLYLRKFGRLFNYGYDGSSIVIRDSSNSKVDKFLKMNISLERVKNLEGLVTVSVKRVHGNIWDFKRFYQQFIKRMQLGIHSLEPDLWS